MTNAADSSGESSFTLEGLVSFSTYAVGAIGVLIGRFCFGLDWTVAAFLAIPFHGLACGIVNNESIDIKRNFNGKLSEMLPADHELFKAYPEARDIDLKVTYRKNGSYAGWQKGNAIEVNAGPDGKESRSALVHEIQHWIQDKEGFAIGGNSGTYSRVARNKV